jgi:hypothetical protein
VFNRQVERVTGSLHTVPFLNRRSAVEEMVCQVSAVGSDGGRYVVAAMRSVAGALPQFEASSERPETDPSRWRYLASVPGVDRGYPAERLGKGVYRLDRSGVTLTFHDPAAP